MPEVDRVYGQEYVLPISENKDVVSQYKNGEKAIHLGENRSEFPYRSIIRGDFDSKYCGTVTWNALQKFKRHLLDKVLSYQGQKLPKSIWDKALTNYIYNRVQEINQEKVRWTYQNTWYNFSPTTHRFFTIGSYSGFTYSWNQNETNPTVYTCYMRRQKRITYQQETINGFTWKYVGKDGVDLPNPYDLDWNLDPLGTETYGFPNRYYFKRLGESDEFSLYMPEYEATFNSSSVTTRPDGYGGSIYVQTNYSGNQYSDTGLLDDMLQHITQLSQLKYDYSNLDEVLTKNWLYLKTSVPNIESLGTNEVISSQPYYNEVYINNKLADVYLLCVLDLNPPNPGGGEYSNPDFLVRDKWKTRAAGAGEFQVDGRSLEKIRPQCFEYQFLERLLIHNKSSNPFMHSANDPRIIEGVDYEFKETGGQPNNKVTNKFKFTPMRLKLRAQKQIRGEYVLIMDSTAYDTESKILSTREKVLPVVLDKRLTYFDLNPGTENSVISDYNVNVTGEFPWMAEFIKK